MVGEILAGILIGPSLFGTLVSDRLFPVDVRPALAGLANVGLVLFMFIVGYELDQSLVRGRQRIAVSVSRRLDRWLRSAWASGLALWLAGRHAVTDVGCRSPCSSAPRWRSPRSRCWPASSPTGA